jgi:hypothetical protein
LDTDALCIIICWLNENNNNKQSSCRHLVKGALLATSRGAASLTDVDVANIDVSAEIPTRNPMVLLDINLAPSLVYAGWARTSMPFSQRGTGANRCWSSPWKACFMFMPLRSTPDVSCYPPHYYSVRRGHLQQFDPDDAVINDCYQRDSEISCMLPLRCFIAMFEQSCTHPRSYILHAEQEAYNDLKLAMPLHDPLASCSEDVSASRS